MLWKLVFVATMPMIAAPYQERVEATFTDICIAANGANTIIDKPHLQASLLKCMACVVKEVDSDILQLVSDEVAKRNYEAIPLTRICPKAPQLTTCMMGFIEDMSACLPDGFHRYIRRTIPKLIEFACEHMPLFFKEDGRRCLQKAYNDEEATYCFSNVGKDVVNKTFPVMTEKDYCSMADQGTSCLMNLTCSNPTPVKLFKKLHDKIDCNKSVSMVLQSGVLRLILGLMFIHLLFDKFYAKC